ncbi:MAG: hypothetical protein WD035_11680 [Balneolaceae bacterium]
MNTRNAVLLNSSRPTIPNPLKQKFHENLKKVSETNSLLAETHKKKLLSSVDILTDSEEGVRFLYHEMESLIQAGIFTETMWEDPARLVPSLVGGTLKAGGETTVLEILSELRMLALANEEVRYKKFQPGKARVFLEETLVNNLDLIFPDESDGLDSLDENTLRKIRALFEFLTEQISVDQIKGRLAKEIELICVQRPVVTDRVLQIISTVKHQIQLSSDHGEDRRLNRYIQAVFAPSEKAGELSDEEYSQYLNQAKRKQILQECEALSETMRETGLAVSSHAILLRHVADDLELMKKVLGLDKVGRAELDQHKKFVAGLIRAVIQPDTARSSYGLAKLLERSLLSHQPVKSGLQRILGLDLHADVASTIKKSRPETNLDPKYILVAECLGILGQPLGVGQGWNPTCQSARGISLWSSHAPGKLLRMIESAAKSNSLWMRFEGTIIKSEELIPGLVKELDYNLDAVSVVLVPHLDKIYNEMMRRAANRADDPHKWVNPAMYGHWIPTGFISAYDYLTNSIKDYEKFVRTFYITHHPEYNGGHDLAYPNPVGIFLTSSTGKLIGFHAVSILRVRKIKGQTRVFILNPNNEGRQRWQDTIRPTVAGNGERPGESSLPFHQFASRLYAFHYNRADLEGLNKVDDHEIQKVVDLAKSSWSESYQWTEPAGYPDGL